MFKEDSLFRLCAASREELKGWKSSDAKPIPQGLFRISVYLCNQDAALTSKGFSYFVIDRGQPFTVATPCA